MRHRAAVLLAGLLGAAAAVPALPAPAGAAVEGFDVTITEVPDEFRAGADARTVEVVASTDERGGCRKVRWSMVLEVDGVDLDQVRVDRIEEDDSFPLRVQTDGDTARLTDVRFDPGSLCRDRTVTARYRVAFDDDAAAGRVTFQAQAFDAGTRLLQEATATSRVIGEPPSSPAESESPEPEESEEPEQSEQPEEPVAEPAETDDAAAAPGDGGPAAQRASAQSGPPSLLVPGLIIGAALVFAGVGLLLRMRTRTRDRAPTRHAARPSYRPSR